VPGLSITRQFVLVRDGAAYTNVHERVTVRVDEAHIGRPAGLAVTRHPAPGRSSMARCGSDLYDRAWEDMLITGRPRSAQSVVHFCSSNPVLAIIMYRAPCTLSLG